MSEQGWKRAVGGSFLLVKPQFTLEICNSFIVTLLYSEL